MPFRVLRDERGQGEPATVKTAAQHLVLNNGVLRSCGREKRAILAAKEEERPAKLAGFLGKIVEGLRNEELQLAMDLTDDDLNSEKALDVLVQKVEKYVVAFQEEEAKALFSAGTRIG